MFEQDPIMRQIHDIVKAAAKMMHMNVDIASEHLVQIEDAQVRETADLLLQMIDSGKINEAENELYTLLESRTLDHLHTGIAFYSRLEEKEDDFLTACNFSREEIIDGRNHMLACYGLDGTEELFFGE